MNAKKENVQKRLQRSTIKRDKSKQIWVPKSIIEEIHSQASKEQGKYKAIWIPKSLLKDLNIENKSKLTFKLPKASTSSSSKHLPKPISNPSTPSSSKIYLLPHTSKPQAISSTNPKSFGKNLDVQHKKYKNPLKNEDHYVPSNQHVNSKKEKTFKRPQRSTTQRAK